MTRVPITAIILTKNEARVIERTIHSLLCLDQVVVVDSASEDGTPAIARGAGADVVDFLWDGQYPKKKQWALEHSDIRNRWVLFVDADEIFTRSLLDEMGQQILCRSSSADSPGAYSVEYAYRFDGRILHHGHRVRKVVLLDKDRCHFPVVDDLNVANMWEVEGHYQPVIDGEVGALSGEVVHDDVDPLYSYFARHNRYSDWEAHLRVNKSAQRQVRASKTLQGRIFDRLPLKPLLFFVYSYVLRAGFRDGIPGLNYALSLAFYYWQINVKTREARRAG
ncbi:glycosyltransferase family 2 protein [Pseudonocardia endophytica]|uniref:Glycosyl transferase family 2 n=1 Tax=Pseudonocardia endophytica TaxID=401976 RepID=A0A4R1HU25_PSEEN|nr:glycosyltransferase family 2 protein [Pseudonocardia endophytica]TCK20932.1 glycosyl transferase family 2 [Pseudonocardia endophytica]